MYLQSGKNRPRIRSNQHRAELETPMLNRLPGIFKVLAFFAIVAGICNAYIYLNQQRNNTARSITKLRTELIRIENETINERNQGERLRDWSNIQAQIRRYQLPLELPERGQRRQIALLTPQQAANVHYQVASNPAAALNAVAMNSISKAGTGVSVTSALRPLSANASVAIPVPERKFKMKRESSAPLFGRNYRLMRRQR